MWIGSFCGQKDRAPTKEVTKGDEMQAARSVCFSHEWGRAGCQRCWDENLTDPDLPRQYVDGSQKGNS